MKTIKYFMFFFAITALVSCSNSEKKEDGAPQSEEGTVSQGTPKFQNFDPALAGELNQVVQHYIHLKNALVKSNSSEAKAGADGILNALAGVDSTKLSAEQKTEYLSSSGKIKNGSKEISESTDIEKQRESFNIVTEGIYMLIKSFRVGKPLYYEFCPMANNNNGGYWISESSEVDNPYFGDEMPHCGEVKETIK